MNPPEMEPVTFREGETLAMRSVRGVAWIGAAKIFRHGFLALVNLSLLWILERADFGLLREVLIVTQLGTFLAALGFTEAIVQKKNLTREGESSAFWSSLLFSILGAALVFPLAPWLGRFFGTERVIPLVRAGALAIPLTVAGTVPCALLTRKMEWKKILWPELIGGTLGGLASVAMALLGAGVWSLIGGLLLTSALSSLLFFVYSGWRPRIQIHWEPVWDLLTIGLPIVGSHVLFFAQRNIDYILVGHRFGEDDLGIYDRSFELTAVIPIALSVILTRVGLSAFSSVQEDVETLKRGFLAMLRYSMLLTVPVLALFSVFAPEIAGKIMGERFAAAAGPIAVLAWMSILNSAAGLPGLVWIARGRADVRFYWNGLMALTLLLATAIGLRWGIMGVCYALLIRSALTFFWPAFITKALIGLEIRRYFDALWPYLASGFVMTGLLWPLNRLESLYLFRNPFLLLPDLARLFLLAGIGWIIYMGTVFFLRPSSSGEFRTLIRRFRGHPEAS